MKGRVHVLAGLVLLAGLPLLGVWLAGGAIGRYLEFPPTTQYVEHAPFSWWVFAGGAMILIAVIWRATLCRGRLPGRRPRQSVALQEDGWVERQGGEAMRSPVIVWAARFPWWGWCGVAGGVVAWGLAWTRFEWFAGLQMFTFTPLWLAYVVVVNALTYSRRGRCLLTDRPGHLAGLFVLSAGFWWFFEYLNRFVQNWHYVGIGTLTPVQYFIFATLPFSTVLPAVLSTHEWLATFPRLTAGLGGRQAWSPARPRRVAWIALGLAGVGLAGIGVFPDQLFPLLWIAPLAIVAALQTLGGHETVFSDVGRGDWSRLVRLSLAALVCGFFWEMWNYHSLAKWIYTVPYVNRFKVFEMPVLGYAGYLPFGWECAVIAGVLESWEGRRRAEGKGQRAESEGRWAKSGGWRNVVLTVFALLAGAVLWLPFVHLLFRPRLESYRVERGVAPEASALARRQVALWSDPALREQELQRMRQSNAEWDFMGRTFFVMALANMSLREPAEQDRYLAIMDRIIGETLKLERERGKYYFLMDYARAGPFVSKRGRSLFQDGEIALMMGGRRLVREHDDYARLMGERVKVMTEVMQESPVLSGESYPNECWMFCNAVALAAIKIHDVLDGADHREFQERWLSVAKQRLTDPRTGLLISSYSFTGDPYDGPEGSSIWMVAHCLQLIDAEFAADQYRRARRELGRTVLGFGYAREWPSSWRGPTDVDSGPIVPGLEASAGSSGLALLGAGAFGDDAYLRELLTSLNYGGFPVRRQGELKYCASNPVGDAVMLYALVAGPAWEEVRRRERRHP